MKYMVLIYGDESWTGRQSEAELTVHNQRWTDHSAELQEAGVVRDGAALQQALDLVDGTDIDLALTPTKEWPEPEVPQDLGAALEDADDLEATWASITPMARWEWVRWVGATRSPDTSARRVEVSIDKLRGGKRRPCCFDLSSCTEPDLAPGGKLRKPS